MSDRKAFVASLIINGIMLAVLLYQATIIDDLQSIIQKRQETIELQVIPQEQHDPPNLPQQQSV